MTYCAISLKREGKRVAELTLARFAISVPYIVCAGLQNTSDETSRDRSGKPLFFAHRRTKYSLFVSPHDNARVSRN